MSTACCSLEPATPARFFDNRGRERICTALFLLGSCIFLFADAKISPVALQDEARNAINAIEMYLSGFSLITTFNFQPDMWNTKPPLLIWLMSASMSLFGPSEWAIRLPSALAAIGILLCTLLFVRRITGSLSLAIASASLMVISPGFFGEHGARTADFDATLTFFVTAGLQLLFFAVHQARPGMRSMLLIGGLIAAGALTKSIAAFIPLTGAFVYLLAVRRVNRVLSIAHRYALAAAVAVAPLLIFYVLREAAAPGYVSTVMHNDVAGRFSESLIRPTSPFYYVTELSMGWFVAGPFIVAAPLALISLSGRSRLLFIYAASIASISLLVYSAATNRAVQYALPIFPWLSIMGAFTLRYLIQLLAKVWQNGNYAQAIILGAGLVAASGQLIYSAADWRYHRFPKRDFYPQSSYGDLFAELAARGITRFTVVDPGNLHLGKTGYAPLLRWNRLIWERKGLDINHELKQRAETPVPLASCQPLIFDRWNGVGLEKIGRCAVLWRIPGRPSA